MSNSNFVVTPATTNPSGIVSLGSIVSPAPFFDPIGNLNMNGRTLIGPATQVALTSNNTISTACFIPFSQTSSSIGNNLFIDNVTTPLTYTPSTGEFLSSSFAATLTNGTQFSRLSSTQLQVANVPSNITTITSNLITVGPSTATNATISPTTVTATTFVTNTAPAAGNQLGNKTYIDNFGGSGGWYFTLTVSVTASTTVNFPNCLNNTFNAYEIYFVPNFTAPTTGFPNLDMTFSGTSGPTYQTFTQTQTTGGSLSQTFNTSGPRLLHGFDFSSILNRRETIKLDLWGTRNISGGNSSSRFSYLSEGFNASNPGQTAWIKNFGTVAFSFGSPTGITFIYSVAVTGSITIVVKAKY